MRYIIPFLILTTTAQAADKRVPRLHKPPEACLTTDKLSSAAVSQVLMEDKTCPSGLRWTNPVKGRLE